MGFALSNMQLTSAVFSNDGRIPSKHTGEGEDVSPALSWSGEPAGTQSFAVVCHDPDAPLIGAKGTYGFVHWALYNIPSNVHSLPEGVDAYASGRTDFGKTGYGGPMPPPGHGTHRYYFWILALNAQLDLPEGLTLWQLLEKVEPHVIGMNRLVGVYSRG
ncbi:YbhB/YbcL family Raf kinase inhibitor-like protein [Hahella sp. HN01]|uniref:YbhB/YbcL family Raf kinase inhibitor-like protein n=1 Tax=Hahella sp. HN01 TaxID=2847262 RepID=UPI001C1EB350|nr:YbhB/YbcL family Raf kinase inhibitor-like protein [Hahella sp. HN01]MBU6954454.1 YbhB/YbcL family Raf kinase inhibitor-like protein [Hahella sp. HN01]